MPADPNSLRQPAAVDRLTVQRSVAAGSTSDDRFDHADDTDHTALERRLHDAVHADDGPVDIDLLDGQVLDQAATQAWGEERSIRAAELRRLLLHPPERADPRGIRLAGVRIVGELDLTSATVTHPLRLHCCTATDGRGIVLDYATLTRLELTGCRLAGLTARGAKINQRLGLAGTSVTEHAAVLEGAQVGQLDCTGAQLSGADQFGNALAGDGLRVDGELSLRGALITTGAIRLLGAHITGDLDCLGTQLAGADQIGNALAGDGLRVDGLVSLAGARTTAGGIRLLGAHITSELDCTGAQLTGADQDGHALQGSQLRVDSDLLLHDVLTTTGGIVLVAARITGDLDCTGAQLAGVDHDGDTLFGEDVEVAHNFFWRPATPVQGRVVLGQARVGRLVDDLAEEEGRWPPDGKLILTGLVYAALGPQAGTVHQRLGWVRRQLPDYSPQPYEQLAAVYRAGGHEREARQVLVAARDDLRKHGSLTRPQRLGNRLLGVLLGHGYRPARVLLPLAAVYLAMLLLFGWAENRGAVVSARPTPVGTPVPTAAVCTSAHPCFSPWGAAVDTVVPLVRLGQAEAWRLDASAPWGWAYRAGAWAGTGLGWALTTLAALGYTGLVRKP